MELGVSDIKDFLESLNRIADYTESIAINLQNAEERRIAVIEERLPKFEVLDINDIHTVRPYACSICGASITRSKFNDHEEWHEQHGG